MYNGIQVIDCHGHMSIPAAFTAEGHLMMMLRRGDSRLHFTDEQLRPAIERHLAMLDERDIDVQFISPRPVAMMHWERPYIVHGWTKTTNDVIKQECEFAPDRFIGIAQLPQNPLEDTSHCIEELERCINELGFVGAILNPDPGADRRAPGVNEEFWFPLYEKAEELRATLVVHPSLSRDPRLDIIPRSFQYNNMTEETLAMLLYKHSDVFEHFPELKVVVCHCGGALARILEGAPSSGQRGGGSSGIPQGERVNREARDVSENLFVDSCAYDPHFLRAAIQQIGVARMVFGTEVPGAGTEMLNVETNRPSDDIVSTLASFDFLSEDDRRAILHDNLLRAFPLAAAALKMQA